MSATEVVYEMVGELRNGMRIGRMRKLQERLQATGAEADRLLLGPIAPCISAATNRCG